MYMRKCVYLKIARIIREDNGEFYQKFWNMYEVTIKRKTYLIILSYVVTDQLVQFRQYSSQINFILILWNGFPRGYGHGPVSRQYNLSVLICPAQGALSWIYGKPPSRNSANQGHPQSKHPCQQRFYQLIIHILQTIVLLVCSFLDNNHPIR